MNKMSPKMSPWWLAESPRPATLLVLKQDFSVNDGILVKKIFYQGKMGYTHGGTIK